MVRGLAWRCWASRSVKKACSVGAIRVMTGPPTTRCPGGRRPARAAPERPRGTSRWSSVRGARGRSTATGSWPATSSPARYQPSRVRDRESVAEVVQPRRAGRTGADAGVVDELPEGLRDHGVEQPLRGEGDEEARLLRPWLELIAQPGVVLQRRHAAGVQGHQPGLAELGLADQQHALGPVDVAAVELDRLTDPQPAGRKQPDQGVVGRRPQRRRRSRSGPGSITASMSAGE